MWKGNITTVSPIPSNYCRNLTLCIWIAWVFEWEEQFTNATFIAIKQCYEPMCTLGLPIPERMIEQIDLKRYKAMESIIESLHGLREMYLDPNYICFQSAPSSFTCGSMLYGAISKGMFAIDILSPRPQIPFTGMTFERLCTDVCDFKYPSAAGNSSYYYNHHQTHYCNLTTAVTRVVDSVVGTVGGFYLQTLKEL
ncbi:hypothetical protein PSPO01_03127 [Paraphaeosphaeria sporulosa]